MWSAILRVVVILSIAAFCVLHGMAALTYPGGTVFDSYTTGYRFWGNYLCDLTHSTALNGDANPSANLARVSMLALSTGLAACFWLVPPLLRMRRREAVLTRWLGTLALPGIWIATLAPIGAMGDHLHSVAVFSGAMPGLAATVLAVRASFRRRREHPFIGWSGMATFVTSLIDSVLYALVISGVLSTPKALPSVQKLALLSLMTWMMSVATENRLGPRTAR
jgi:hypothetical protein